MEKLQRGDIVTLKGYVGVVVIEEEWDLSFPGRQEWACVDIRFLTGESKTNNCDPVTFKDVDRFLFRP
jgi:hypothetical protein